MVFCGEPGQFCESHKLRKLDGQLGVLCGPWSIWAILLRRPKHPKTLRPRACRLNNPEVLLDFVQTEQQAFLRRRQRKRFRFPQGKSGENSSVQSPTNVFYSVFDAVKNVIEVATLRLFFFFARSGVIIRQEIVVLFVVRIGRSSVAQEI